MVPILPASHWLACPNEASSAKPAAVACTAQEYRRAGKFSTASRGCKFAAPAAR